MATKTLLKNDGKFVYDDYKPQKIGKRLVDLGVDEIQPVRRTTNGPIVAYMVSETWFQAKVEEFDLASTAMPDAIFDEVSDDFVAHNFSTLVNTINGVSQVKSQIPKTNAEGPQVGKYKGYILINTKPYKMDPYLTKNETFASSQAIVEGAVKKARLLDPAHFNEIFTGP